MLALCSACVCCVLKGGSDAATHERELLSAVPGSDGMPSQTKGSVHSVIMVCGRKMISLGFGSTEASRHVGSPCPCVIGTGS